MRKNIVVKIKEKRREEVPIETDFIRLDSFLKLSGAVMTGGEAKERVQAGEVRVNDEVCTQRGKKLHPGDSAQLESTIYTVTGRDQ